MFTLQHLIISSSFVSLYTSFMRERGAHPGWLVVSDFLSRVPVLLMKTGVVLLNRVPTSATASDIKKAYYKLSLKLYVCLPLIHKCCVVISGILMDVVRSFFSCNHSAVIQIRTLIRRPRANSRRLLLLMR